VVDSLQTARRENMLLDNMIDYMRIQDNNLRVELTATSVMPVIEAFVEHATPVANRRDILVKVDAAGDIPEVLTDDRYLRRILDALFDNAMRFCTRGCEFTVKVQQDDQQLGLLVMDDGRAIFPQYEQKIFGQRQQLEMRVAGSRASVAANLPFARAAARLMGGDLQAKSDDSWTTFSLTLPIAKE
jgi:K+-sensing histidine kinase KdpD